MCYGHEYLNLEEKGVEGERRTERETETLRMDDLSTGSLIINSEVV
jgi:hypothetical protein